MVFKLKHIYKKATQFLAFAFYPKTTLIACAVFSGIVIVILGLVMTTIPRESAWYNVVFALTTGAAGSFFVTFIVELAGNYKHNKLAWYEMQDYYSSIVDFESHKQIMMKLTPTQRAEQKAHEEFIAAGGIEEFDDLNQPKDIIQITWDMLPNIIPVFRRTLENKKEFLSDNEIIELNNIISDYSQIQFAIKERIMMSPMYYDALNNPDEDYLKSLYPLDVINNMPDWIKSHLASEESQMASERFAETILSDAYLLSRFMEDYEISQKGIDDYQNGLHRLEKEEENYEPEDIDFNEIDYSEPEDEETFQQQIEAYEEEYEQSNRPFKSWYIRSNCKKIAESIDVLEKHIRMKPFYGMMIDYYKSSSSMPTDDLMSSMSYESEKKRLDEILAKQKVEKQ